MAGNGHRDGVRRTGPGDRPHRLRGADALGDLTVARGLAGRNGAQRFPDPLLERSAAHVERQVEAEHGRFDDTRHPCHHRFERRIPAHELRVREAVFEVVHQGVRVVTEQDRAHPLAGGGDEHRAE